MRNIPAKSLLSLLGFVLLPLLAVGALASSPDDEVWQQLKDEAVQIPVLRPSYIPAVFSDAPHLDRIQPSELLIEYRSGEKYLRIVAGSFNIGAVDIPIQEMPFRGTTGHLIRFPLRDGLEETVVTWWESGGPFTRGIPPNQTE